MVKILNSKQTSKRVIIEQTNKVIVIVTAVAAFVTVFSLVATKTLISQAGYQNRIITAKKAAKNQLVSNLAAESALKSSFVAFATQPQNVLGGNPNSNGLNDGNNAQIILDALPSQYDYPALLTSVEKIVNLQPLVIQSMTGTDEGAGQSAGNTSSNAQPISMSFGGEVQGSYQSILQMISDFQLSIRPLQFVNFTLASVNNESNMTLTLTAQSYYQPGVTFTLGSKTVK